MAALLSSSTLIAPSARRSHVLKRSLYGGSVSSALNPQISSPIASSQNLSHSSASVPWSPLPARYGSRSVCCEAAGEGSPESFDGTVYKGIYGPWTIEPSDVREVILYRSGLVTAATSFVLAASVAFLPENAILGEFLKQNIDFIYVVGAGGLGLSLLLIHIYVTPIKRFLQALWAIGVFGSAATYLNLANPLDEGLVQYVVENPSAIWFVGPLFAALTGLVFKEGLCYGKLEAGVLTFIIPGLLLGHLLARSSDRRRRFPQRAPSPASSSESSPLQATTVDACPTELRPQPLDQSTRSPFSCNLDLMRSHRSYVDLTSTGDRCRCLA